MRTAASAAQHPSPPATVIDPAMWSHGIALAERHRKDPQHDGWCMDTGCRTRRHGVCWVRPIAEQLIAASSGSWARRWTTRHDARSCGLLLRDVSPLADQAGAAPTSTWDTGNERVGAQ